MVAQEVNKIHKGFVPAGKGSVHYVRQGEGPAIVLLHASPCSAKAMASQQAAWSQEFTTFAFDLPGLGLSDFPQEHDITIDLLGDLIAEAMRNLGLTNAALYGRHTGASVCLSIAVRHPELSAMLLTDGLPVFPKPYTPERLGKYLSITKPDWAGTYLTWTFFRYREQHMFWPWDACSAEHRADADLPDANFLHRGTVEMLEAAATYIPVYRAAFIYDTLSHIGDVHCPAFYGNRPGDSQFKTIPHYPAGTDIQVMSRDPKQAELAELELLRAHPATGKTPGWSSRIGQESVFRDYIETRHGVVYAMAFGLERPGTPTVFLHDMPGGTDVHKDEIEKLGQQGPVIAFDLAGNGNSDTSAAINREIWLEQIDDVTNHLNWGHVRLVAAGLSAPVATGYAARAGHRVAGIVLRSPPLLTPQERGAFANHPVPDITPVASGSHLLELWHHLRDQELWWPWFDTSHHAIRKTAPRIDPSWLNRRAVTILKQAHHYATIWHVLLQSNVAAEMNSLSIPVTIEIDPVDVFAPCAERHMQGKF